MVVHEISEPLLSHDVHTKENISEWNRLLVTDNNNDQTEMVLKLASLTTSLSCFLFHEAVKPKETSVPLNKMRLPTHCKERK